MMRQHGHRASAMARFFGLRFVRRHVDLVRVSSALCCH
ncbi:MAG TPA: putative leader peptide [Actinocrinis sp.]|jgi:hypothetical protein